MGCDVGKIKDVISQAAYDFDHSDWTGDPDVILRSACEKHGVDKQLMLIIYIAMVADWNVAVDWADGHVDGASI